MRLLPVALIVAAALVLAGCGSARHAAVSVTTTSPQPPVTTTATATTSTATGSLTDDELTAVNDAIDQYVSDLLPGGTGYPSDDAQLVAHDLGAIAIRDRGLLNSASRAASDWASLGLVLRAPIRSPNIREVAEAANRDLMRIDPRINTAPMP